MAASSAQHDPLSSLKQIKEDPELAKKSAEKFEKDRMAAIRKREAAEDRNTFRKDRVLGRSGLGGGRTGGAGLSVAGLEDDEGMPTARGRNRGANATKRRMNRRGDIYSDDEDEDHPRGHTREDEYDREDDFLAASDEEPEVYDDEGEEVEGEAEGEDDDPDVDDLEIEGRQTVVPGRTRGGERERSSTPKRAASEEDAEGEADEDTAPQARKKRRIIDDDEDEE
jgi:RNA polymerase-associated protein LEO1